MSSSFDSVLRGIKVDIANWRALGQLKPNDKFEVDFYGRTQKIHMGETSNPGMIKKITNAAKEAFTYTPSEEEAARGIVRISHTGVIGGLERTVNRTYFGSVATAEETVKWLDDFIDKTTIDVAVLKAKFEEPMPAGLSPEQQREFRLDRMELFRAIISLRNELSSSKKLITNLQTTYSDRPDVHAKLDDIEAKLNGDQGIIELLKDVELSANSQLSIADLTAADTAINSFEVISEKDPIDILAINERTEIKDAWKVTLKKDVPFKAIPGQPLDQEVLAPDIFRENK